MMCREEIQLRVIRSLILMCRKLLLRLSQSGVYFTKQAKNELEFEIENKSHFEIKLTGFDEKQGLIFKTSVNDPQIQLYRTE